MNKKRETKGSEITNHKYSTTPANALPFTSHHLSLLREGEHKSG
jgi:hypothetical protein